MSDKTETMLQQNNESSSDFLNYNPTAVNGFYDTIPIFITKAKNLKGFEYSFFTQIIGKTYEETNMCILGRLPENLVLSMTKFWVIVSGFRDCQYRSKFTDFTLIRLSLARFSLNIADEIVSEGLFSYYMRLDNESPESLLIKEEPSWYDNNVPKMLVPCIISPNNSIKATLSFERDFTPGQSMNLKLRCWLHGEVMDLNKFK